MTLGAIQKQPSGGLAQAVEPAAVETPSGKGAGDENFPVGSFLIARRLRPHVARYYAFARAADDIADNAALPAAEKIRRLDAFEAALSDGSLETPARLAESLSATGVDVSCASDLLIAFRRDATKLRYQTWEELLDYCRYSANPVGRFLLQVHGEDAAALPYSDALCTALQILNHMQDMGDDRRDFDRIYMPRAILAAHGEEVEAIDRPALSPGLRRALDDVLDRTEVLIEKARSLPVALKSRRLAAESAVIVRLAARLLALLRAGDPLARRVALRKTDFAAAFLLAGLPRLLGGARA
ncbi:MAG: squalene synthase HpnC [Pseudomonadota bacterium]